MTGRWYKAQGESGNSQNENKLADGGENQAESAIDFMRCRTASRRVKIVERQDHRKGCLSPISLNQ